MDVSPCLAYLELAHLSCSRTDPVTGGLSSMWDDYKAKYVLLMTSRAGWQVAGDWQLAGGWRVAGGWQSMHAWHTCIWTFDHDGAVQPAQCLIEHRSFKRQHITTGELQGASLLFSGCRSGVWEQPWRAWLAASMAFVHTTLTLKFSRIFGLSEPLLFTPYTDLRAN